MSGLINYVFAAGDRLELKHFQDIAAFFEAYEQPEAVRIQDLVLNHEAQLVQLLNLLGLSLPAAQALRESEDFLTLYDLSSQSLPELSEADYNALYQQWLRLSGRKNSMDEYGQLIFLQGQSALWNQLPHRLILQARWEPTWPDYC